MGRVEADESGKRIMDDREPNVRAVARCVMYGAYMRFESVYGVALTPVEQLTPELKAEWLALADKVAEFAQKVRQ
jgi:hypothetical protein